MARIAGNFDSFVLSGYHSNRSDCAFAGKKVRRHSFFQGGQNVLGCEREFKKNKLRKNVLKEVRVAKVKIIAEYIEFLKENKKWWLMPIVFALLLFGLLIVLTKGSALAPFIYTLF
jgi:hypothetical protein